MQLLHCRFRPFLLTKKIKMNNFLIILVSWFPYKVNISFLTEKITIFANVWYKSGYVLKTASIVGSVRIIAGGGSILDTASERSADSEPVSNAVALKLCTAFSTWPWRDTAAERAADFRPDFTASDPRSPATVSTLCSRRDAAAERSAEVNPDATASVARV